MVEHSNLPSLCPGMSTSSYQGSILNFSIEINVLLNALQAICYQFHFFLNKLKKDTGYPQYIQYFKSSKAMQKQVLRLPSNQKYTKKQILTCCFGLIKTLKIVTTCLTSLCRGATVVVIQAARLIRQWHLHFSHKTCSESCELGLILWISPISLIILVFSLNE